jgi:MraZ protein
VPVLRDESKFRLTSYSGEFAASLDDKYRLTLPADLRRPRPRISGRDKEMSNRFMLLRGLDKGLGLYPLAEWERIDNNLKQGATTDPDFRYFFRILYASGLEVVLDAQGRIPVSKMHRELAKIDREVIVTGQSHKIEIWNPRVYREYVRFGRVKGTLDLWEKAARKLKVNL